MGLGQDIDDRLWKQGCRLPQILCDQIPKLVCDKNDIVILISQDCDIVNDDIFKEPTVEAHVARPVMGEPNPSYLNGQNPRYFQFVKDGKTFEIAWHQKVTIDRNLLATNSPQQETQLPADLFRTIALWTGRKYYRPSLPTAFNNRLDKKLTKKFGDLVKKRHHLASKLFVKLDPNEEVDAAVEYQVTFAMLVAPDISEEDYAAAEELTKKLCDLLNTATGVNVVDYEAVRESDMTLAEAKTFSEFDYDYLSNPAMDE